MLRISEKIWALSQYLIAISALNKKCEANCQMCDQPGLLVKRALLERPLWIERIKNKGDTYEDGSLRKILSA